VRRADLQTLYVLRWRVVYAGDSAGVGDLRLVKVGGGLARGLLTRM
jgi:hypothetical protein